MRAAGVAIALAAWELFALRSNSRLVPDLARIARAWWALAFSGDLFRHGGATLSEGLTGLACALVAAVAFGFAAARSPLADAAFRPLVLFGYPVPKLALYPIVILALGFGASSKIAQVALECFFPLFVQCYAGARAADRNLVWLARNVAAGRLRFARDVLLPAAAPSVLTGIRIAFPIMLIVMTVTELIGDSQGLGYLIARSASLFDSASAYAVVATLGGIGFVADRTIVALRRRLIFWEKGVVL